LYAISKPLFYSARNVSTLDALGGEIKISKNASLLAQCDEALNASCLKRVEIYYYYASTAMTTMNKKQ